MLTPDLTIVALTVHLRLHSWRRPKTVAPLT
jgi:hypothetical protein